MPVKFKIVFYNLMIFLILFDILYLTVWILSIEMNLVKAVIVAGITALIMPWAKSRTMQSRKKVIIHSLAFDLYKKYQSSRIN